MALHKKEAATESDMKIKRCITNKRFGGRHMLKKKNENRFQSDNYKRIHLGNEAIRLEVIACAFESIQFV